MKFFSFLLFFILLTTSVYSLSNNTYVTWNETFWNMNSYRVTWNSSLTLNHQLLAYLDNTSSCFTEGFSNSIANHYWWYCDVNNPTGYATNCEIPRTLNKGTWVGNGSYLLTPKSFKDLSGTNVLQTTFGSSYAPCGESFGYNTNFMLISYNLCGEGNFCTLDKFKTNISLDYFVSDLGADFPYNHTTKIYLVYYNETKGNHGDYRNIGNFLNDGVALKAVVNPSNELSNAWNCRVPHVHSDLWTRTNISLTTFNISCYDTSKKFNAIVLYFDVLGESSGIPIYQKFAFDNIYIRNMVVNNYTNQLPTLNITYNSSLCLDKTIGKLTVPLNYSYYDLENDTAYYSKRLYRIYGENRTVTFYKKVCNSWLSFICSVNKDYSFLENTFIPNDACNIKYENYNSSNFNLYYDESDHGNFFGLQLKDSCAKSDKSFYFDIGIPTSNLNYFSELRGLSNGDNFNISLINQERTKIITMVNFNISNDNVIISHLNTSNLIELTTNFSLSQLYNGGSNQYETIVEFYDIDSTKSTYKFRIWKNDFDFKDLLNAGSVTSFDIPILNNYPMKYLRTSINSGDFLVMGLQFRGSVDKLNYSTQHINNLTFYDTGLYKYDFFITDSAHINFGTYNIVNMTFNIQDLDYCLGRGDFEPNTDLWTFDSKGKSGLGLLWLKFLYLIQLPYRLLLYFNLLETASFAVLVFVVLFFLRQISYGLNVAIIETFGLSLLLVFMKLLSGFLFAIVTLFFAIVVYREVFGGSSSGNL